MVENLSYTPPDALIKEKNQAVSPWVNFTPKRFITEGSVPAAEGRKTDEEVRLEMKLYRQGIDQRERLASASLSFRIDKKKLEKIKMPEVVKPPDYLADVVEAPQSQEGLEKVVEQIGKLPERLDFKPGITLVVGENGAGKSTLAKAIYLAVKYLYKVQDAKYYAAVHHLSTDSFKDAEEESRVGILTPAKGSGIYSHTDDMFLIQSGIAPEIAQALDVENLAFEEITEYTDCSAVMGERQTTELKIFSGLADAGAFDTHRSHRQTLDKHLEESKSSEFAHYAPNTQGKKDNKKIVFLDEPEAGASPKRHRNIEKDIVGLASEGSVFIVPTNSVVLYESDLPRIDLEYPERGIFRPSDFKKD